jgi:hypothetical protein
MKFGFFGGVECGSKQWFGEVIPERNREILIKLVRKNIISGAIICNDQWAADYSSCDQIVSFIQKERTPIYTFQFARHFAHANPLLVRSWNSRTNKVKAMLLLVQSLYQ